MKKAGWMVWMFLFIFGFTIPIVNIPGNGSRIVAAAEEDEEVDPGTPHLFVAWNSSVQEFRAGETQNLIIPIFNEGDGTASQCYASLSVSNPNEFPFVLDGLKTVRPLTNIHAKQTIWADFGPVQVSSSAKSQLYELTVNVEYRDGMGNLGQESATILVRIINEDYAPKLNFTGVQFQGIEGTALNSGTNAGINLCMQNEGSEPAKDVQITLSGFSQEGINLNQNLDTWKSDQIEGNEVFFVPYQISLHKDMLTGTYPLDLNIKYKDAMNNEITDSAKVYLLVNGKESNSEDHSTPRLIISNYDFSSSYIRAGDSFPLRMIFTNTSEEQDIQNIKVSVSSDENVMSPVGSSNTFVIPKIEKASSLEQSIVLQPVVDADTKTYNVNVEMEYQDEDGNAFTANEVIGVPVVQEIRFTLSELQLPTECYVDMPVDISLDYYNMGRADMRNLMITTEGNFEIRNGELYVGNLEAGKSDYFNATFIPHEAGEQQGVIRFSFEDALGNQYQQEKVFTLNILENTDVMVPEDFEEMPIEEVQEGSPMKPWLIAGGAIIAAGAGIVLYRRHHRKQQEEIEIDE